MKLEKTDVEQTENDPKDAAPLISDFVIVLTLPLAHPSRPIQSSLVYIHGCVGLDWMGGTGTD